MTNNTNKMLEGGFKKGEAWVIDTDELKESVKTKPPQRVPSKPEIIKIGINLELTKQKLIPVKITLHDGKEVSITNFDITGFHGLVGEKKMSWAYTGKAYSDDYIYNIRMNDGLTALFKKIKNVIQIITRNNLSKNY
jgi:hypothetical protein